MTEPCGEALRQAAETSHRWLRVEAWPLWLAHGVDWDRGGFHEHLCPATLTCDADFRRLRVAARQVYAFSHAATAGLPMAQEAVAQEAVALGLRAIRRDFALAGGGYATRCDLRGAVIDGRVDLYDQAFVLLALASAHAAQPSGRLRCEAHGLLRVLDTSLRHPGGAGFLEGRPARLPRRQNPHMHLLEALLAAGESFQDELFFLRASEIVDLLLDRLFQEKAGALAEYFDDGWRPDLEGGRFVVEPGHHQEWIWLLARYAALPDLHPGQRARCAAVSEALRHFTRLFGRGAGRFEILDEVWSDGTIRTPGYSLWPQAEALKAEICRTDRDVGECLRAYGVLQGFFLPEPRGLWRERIDPGGDGGTGIVKASSLYHLTSAILCGSRSLSGPPG